MAASSEPFVFQSSDLEHALESTSRVYLSGHLSLPQEFLRHMSTTSFEMGVSHYHEFTHDDPHLHTTNVEFNYVAEGETHLCDISSGKIWRLSRGGVFIIGPICLTPQSIARELKSFSSRRREGMIRS